jgi:hypothetical protein
MSGKSEIGVMGKCSKSEVRSFRNFEPQMYNLGSRFTFNVSRLTGL